MPIHLGRIYKVDGVDTYLYSVDAGSAKEALAEIEAWADELGAAPNPAMAPGTAAPKRSRRTKAEIEADAAAEVAKNTPPALPPGGAPVQAFAPPQGGPSVALSDKPPVASQPPGVSVSPPPQAPSPSYAPPPQAPSPSYAPPPQQAPISPDQLARADLESAISGLYGSIPHAWVSGAQSIVMGYVNANANGGGIDTMNADQAKRALQLVQNYRKVCDEAPR